MSYVAKLARRLARLRHLVVLNLLAALACGGPTENSSSLLSDDLTLTPNAVTVEPSQQVLFRASRTAGAAAQRIEWTASGGTITSAGLYTAPPTAGHYTVTARMNSDSSSAAVTVVSPASSTESPAPDQPPGYLQIAENGFSEVPPAGAVAGAWLAFGRNFSVVQDSKAPTSPSGVLQFRFPAGTRVGASVGLLEAWARSADGKPLQYREIYETGWFKIPGADFETPGPGMKLLGYWGVGQAGTGRPANQVYALLPGNLKGTSLMSSWKLDIRQQNNVDRSMSANRSTKRIRAGVWQRYAIQMVLNDVDVPNGVLRVWLDTGDGTGLTLTHEYTDVMYRTSAAKSADGIDSRSGFYGRNWDPIWGGMGGAAKSRTDYLWVDHIYISGRPL